MIGDFNLEHCVSVSKIDYFLVASSFLILEKSCLFGQCQAVYKFFFLIRKFDFQICLFFCGILKLLLHSKHIVKEVPILYVFMFSVRNFEYLCHCEFTLKLCIRLTLPHHGFAAFTTANMANLIPDIWGHTARNTKSRSLN